MAFHLKRDQAGFRAGNRVGTQELVAENFEAIDADRLKPQIEISSFTRRLDSRFDQPQIFIEDRILERNRQSKDAVEPALDSRKVVGQPAIGILEPKAGSLDEIAEARRLQLAIIQQVEPTAECIPSIIAFEIIGRIEEVLTAGLALSSRQGTKAVEPASDGRDKPPFALHIGGHRSEQRGRGLVGAVGTTEPLDCIVRPPARFEQEVDAALLVLAVEIGMIGTPGPASIRKDEDALRALHEALRFGDIGTAASPFEPLLPIPADNEPAAAPGYFGDRPGPKMLDDRVERCGDWRKRAKLFDQRIARGNGTRAKNRITVVIAHRFGAQIAVLVGKDLHQAHREALGEIVDDVFARTKVDIECLAFLVAEIGEAAVEHGLSGRNQLHDHRMIFTERFFYSRDETRQFHRQKQLRKEALLCAFKF